MSSKRRRTLVLAALASVASVACSNGPERPNIIFITLDTTRADHLSLYGYERETDPFLVEFARDAVVFENALSPASWTLPSHASMFTGLDPVEHGARHRTGPDVPEGRAPALSDELPLFTTRLASAGYHLIGSVSGRYTAARFGFGRDFNAYLEPTATAQLSGSTLNQFVFESLRRKPEGAPLCLFVNFLEAHSPYEPPDGDYPYPDEEPAQKRFQGFPPGAMVDQYDASDLQLALDLYDRELRVQDAALQELLTGLGERGLLDNTLIFITSDHGEAFGEHGLLAHGNPPFQSQIHVPLIIRRTIDGEVQARGRVQAPVSLSNTAETILAQAGLESLPGNERRFDLLALPDEPPPVYVEFRETGGWTALLRVGDLKYLRVLESPILAHGEFVYDLASDPMESTPLVIGDSAPPALQELRAQFEALRAAWRPEPVSITYPALDPSDYEALKELGYL